MLLRKSGIKAAPMRKGKARAMSSGMSQLLKPIFLLTRKTGAWPPQPSMPGCARSRRFVSKSN